MHIGAFFQLTPRGEAGKHPPTPRRRIAGSPDVRLHPARPPYEKAAGAERLYRLGGWLEWFKLR
jgi:hypothetical protein